MTNKPTFAGVETRIHTGVYQWRSFKVVKPIFGMLTLEQYRADKKRIDDALPIRFHNELEHAIKQVFVWSNAEWRQERETHE